MDEASLEKAITKMERELLALKTSHQIGVGTIRFYESSIEIESTTNMRVRIKIANSEPVPPFLLVAAPNGVVLSPNVNEDTRIATVSYGSSIAMSGTVLAVSSSLIEYMEEY